MAEMTPGPPRVEVVVRSPPPAFDNVKSAALVVLSGLIAVAGFIWYKTAAKPDVVLGSVTHVHVAMKPGTGYPDGLEAYPDLFVVVNGEGQATRSELRLNLAIGAGVSIPLMQEVWAEKVQEVQVWDAGLAVHEMVDRVTQFKNYQGDGRYFRVSFQGRTVTYPNTNAWGKPYSIAIIVLGCFGTLVGVLSIWHH